MKHHSEYCGFSFLVTLQPVPTTLADSNKVWLCDCDWLWPTMAVIITIQKWTINTMAVAVNMSYSCNRTILYIYTSSHPSDGPQTGLGCSLQQSCFFQEAAEAAVSEVYIWPVAPRPTANQSMRGELILFLNAIMVMQWLHEQWGMGTVPHEKRLWVAVTLSLVTCHMSHMIKIDWHWHQQSVYEKQRRRSRVWSQSGLESSVISHQSVMSHESWVWVSQSWVISHCQTASHPVTRASISQPVAVAAVATSSAIIEAADAFATSSAVIVVSRATSFAFALALEDPVKHRELKAAHQRDPTTVACIALNGLMELHSGKNRNRNMCVRWGELWAGIAGITGITGITG